MEYNPITVSELNQYIKDKIGRDEYLNNVFIKGEISNFKHHYTGHMYFTLKDDKSLIKCIMFKSYTANLNFVPKDGLKVMILGTVSVFERDGVYQIYCKAMQEDGLGSLHVAYEELKKKLEHEGLFDVAHKKPIPKMPKCIGVLTSNTGSVIRDIINVSTRRNPNVYIKLLPVPVQGEGAAVKIAKAIKIMNEQKLADVIILARGGGSLEDLWPFNEEIVARAIYDSKVPVISAVGHEIDFTISDYVADKRAATPTAAAELAVPNVNELLLNIDKCYERCTNSVVSLINRYKEILSKIKKSSILINPVNLYNAKKQMLLIDTKNLNNSINNILTINNMHLFRLKNSYIITNPNMIYEKKLVELKNNINALELLNPLSSLKRGYGIVKKENKCIENIKKIKINDKIDIYLQGGVVKSIVTDIKEEL